MKIDKLLHLLCSMVIVLTFGRISIWLGLGVGILAGIGKEVVDQIRYKGWDWLDLAADALGLILGLLVMIIL